MHCRSRGHLHATVRIHQRSLGIPDQQHRSGPVPCQWSTSQQTQPPQPACSGSGVPYPWHVTIARKQPRYLLLWILPSSGVRTRAREYSAIASVLSPRPNAALPCTLYASAVASAVAALGLVPLALHGGGQPDMGMMVKGPNGAHGMFCLAPSVSAITSLQYQTAAVTTRSTHGTTQGLRSNFQERNPSLDLQSTVHVHCGYVHF